MSDYYDSSVLRESHLFQYTTHKRRLNGVKYKVFLYSYLETCREIKNCSIIKELQSFQKYIMTFGQSYYSFTNCCRLCIKIEQRINQIRKEKKEKCYLILNP